MEIFSRIGMVFSLLVTAVVGARLLILACDTRKLPELVMGLACLGLGTGSALVVVAGAIGAGRPALGVLVAYIGIAMTSSGSAFLCLGMWKIFRPADRWAAACALIVALFLLGAYGVLLVADHGGAAPTEHAAYWPGFAVRIASLWWLAAESLRYSGMLRRRVALGLAEPLMVHRFLLWGVSGVTTSLGYLIYLGCRLLGQAPGESPLAMIFMGALSIIAGLTLWNAFLPPRFYRRWVLARAVVRSAA